MATPPAPTVNSQLPSLDDPLLQEAAAQQLTSASLSSYAALPNPQLAYEALTSGAAPAVIGAINSQDPQYRSVISSEPAGSQTQAVPTVQPPGVPQNLQSLYTLDWKQFRQQNSQALGQEQNASWRSMGEVPIYNFAYMQGVAQHSDPNRIRQWQTTLHQQGFYQGKLSGVWDQNTQGAFNAMMISRATPDALYSTDPSRKAQARVFLGQMGIDVSALEASERDPASQHAMVVRWMMAQGPDAHVGDKSELDGFASQYGKENLPQAWQQVLSSADGSWWDNLTGGLMNLDPFVPLAAKEAIGAKRAINLKDQLLSSETQEQAQADLQLLNPLVQNVQQDQGFMGFLDSWDRVRTNALLSVKYFFQDALTLPANSGASINPFDPASKVGQQVAAAEGDFFRGWLTSDLQEHGMGEQKARQSAQDWETHYPWMSGITNTVVNIADDPLSYIPNVAADRLPLSFSRAGRATAEMLSHNDPELGMAAARDMVNRLRNGSQADVARFAMRVAQNPRYHGIVDVAKLIGGIPSGDRGVRVVQALHQAVQSGDEMQLLQAIGEHKLDFRIMSGRSFLQWKTRLDGLRQMQDLRRSDVVGLSAMGSLDAGHVMVNARTDLGGALEVWNERAALAGMSDADTRAMIDEIATSSEEQRMLVQHKWTLQWMDSLDKRLRSLDPQLSFQGLLEYDSRLASGRSLRGVVRAGGREQVSEFAVDPRTGARVSSTDLRHDDPAVAQLNAQLRAHEDSVEGLRTLLDTHDANLERISLKGDPQARAEAESQLSALEGELQRLRELRDSYLSRPAPQLPSQLADRFFFPVSNYSIVSYMSPTVRNWDRIANNVLVNGITSIWKPFALARLSTFLRVTFGEDVARTGWELLFSGGMDTLAGAKMLLGSLVKMPVSATAARIRIRGHELGLPSRIPLGQDALVGRDGSDLGKFRVSSEGAIRRPDGSTIKGLQLGEDGTVERAAAEADPEAEQLVGASLQRGRQIPLGGELSRRYRQQLAQANAMDLVGNAAHQLLPGIDTAAYTTYWAGMTNYDKMLALHIESRARDPAIRAWIKAHGASGEWNDEAATAALRDLFSSDDPAMAEIRRLHPDDTAETWAAGLNAMYKEYARRPEVRRWLHSGSVDKVKLRRYLKNTANSATAGWPVINAPRQTLIAEHRITQALGAYPRWMFDEVLQPMLQVARGQGFKAIQSRYMHQLRDFYKGRGDVTEEELQSEANSLALDWMKGNIYMGQRSVRTAAMRNIFPFSGATANMSRFYLRQALTHPYSGDATLRLAAWAQQQQQNNQQYAVGGQGVLAMLGFSGGSAFKVDPFHMFFLTSDGIDSFIPGVGPIFSPLVGAVAHNQGLAESLQNVPGVGQWINYQTGSASPVLPWFADLISGAGTAATGQPFTLPFGGLGISQSSDYINRQADLLIQQRKEQGQNVSDADIQDIYRETGRKLLLEGGLSWALPTTPSVVDQPGTAISNAMKAYDTLTSDSQKSQAIAQVLGVSSAKYEKALTTYTVPDLLAGAQRDSPAVLMAYFDSRVTPEQRDAIAEEFPWVTAWSTSMYNKPIDPDTGRPVPLTLAEFKQQRQQGNVTLMSPTDYTRMIEHNQDLLGGWLSLDAINQAKYAFLRDNGVNTQSSLYKQWEATVYQPALAQLSDPAASAYPGWAKAYGGPYSAPNTLAALGNVTAPLRSLQTLEVIPLDPAWETGTTALWRQALVWRDQAAQEISTLQAGSHNTAEVDLVMQGLQQRLAYLAQQDPQFASQLDRYTFGKWEDVVSYEADAMRTRELYGVA